MTIYIGLDVHSKKTVFVALDSEGNRIGKGTVTTTAEGLTRMLDRVPAADTTVIALESGTLATWTSRFLTSAGIKPAVVDAAEVRTLARRRKQKSDYRDAWELADGIRRGIYRKIVFIPDEPVERLRRILSRRRHFIARRTGTVNAARFVLRNDGRGDLKFTLATDKSWQSMLSHPDIAHLCDYLELHYQAWLVDNACVQSLDARLTEALEPFETELKLLTSIPGVGPISASAMIAAVGDPSRFANASRVASYIGIVPATYDSGPRQVRGHITKAGPSYIRGVLCEAAQQARLRTNPLNPYFRRICAKGGYKKAIVAVAHRLVRIMFAIWRDGREFTIDKLAVQVDRSRTEGNKVVYRLKKSA